MRKAARSTKCLVHHLLEQILNEYIEAAGLQSGQPLFQGVNSSGTEVTGRALNRYNGANPAVTFNLRKPCIATPKQG